MHDVGDPAVLSMFGKRESTCDRIDRRNVLRIGMLGGTGLTQADWLAAKSCAETTNATAPKAVIQVFLGGGPSHYETFDPKPDAPVEIRGPYSPIATNVAGTQVCETLPLLARLADKYSLIRSCCHDNPGHGGGQRYVITGYKSASLEGELPHDYPATGSIVSRVRGSMQHGMPTFLCFGGDGSPEFLGPAFAPFKVYSTGKPVGLEVNPSMKLERMDDRRQLRKSLDNLRRQADTQRLMNSLDTLEQQAYEMLTSTAAHEAFDLKLESDSTRQRYGEHEAGKCCLLARRFIEAGAGFVTLRMGSWDHHGNAGGTITSGMQQNGPPLDQSVSALISDLDERGLSEQVIVLVWGEFGRTPRINQFFGRDHWPQAMSVLLAGGGLKMGRVIGATNRKGEYPADRALSPGDILATVYRQLGINIEHSFINNAGRPIPILNHGAVIPELV